MVQLPEIIDLGSSSSDEDDGEPPHTDGFLSPSMQRRGSTVTVCSESNLHDDDRRRRPTFGTCVKDILEVFPDISHEHVRDLYNTQAASHDYAQTLAQQLIERILDSGPYPKERERLRKSKELKRKREDKNSDDEEADRWRSAGPRNNHFGYAQGAKLALYEAFPSVPAKYLSACFDEHGHLYGAYCAIADTERQYDGNVQKPYKRLKSRRHPGVGSEEMIARLRTRGYDMDGLKQEMDSARRRRQNCDGKVTAAKEAEVREQQCREKGDVIECACCFDEATIAHITHCNGEMPHFFCHNCARMNANNDLGNNKYDLRCMDGSGCKATFSREQRSKFLSEKTIEKLELLQQQGELQSAGLQNFVNCPFCNYGHICPPVEEDREFRCKMLDCREVGLSSYFHLLNGILEYAKQIPGIVSLVSGEIAYPVVLPGVQERQGDDYDHFDGQARKPPQIQLRDGKCPLFDGLENRKEQQIENAGIAAMEQIRKDNPGISEKDLEIKFSKEVEARKYKARSVHRPGERVLPPGPLYHPVRNLAALTEPPHRRRPPARPLDHPGRFEEGLQPHDGGFLERTRQRLAVLLPALATVATQQPNPARDFGGQGPVYGGPLYGQPLLDPFYGGQPPPLYGGQPPPYGGQPPLYGGQPLLYVGQPPLYGGQLPGLPPLPNPAFGVQPNAAPR
ncbi:MAG: hypothetical protein Q9163_001103 [Psora crenata]